MRVRRCPKWKTITTCEAKSQDEDREKPSLKISDILHSVWQQSYFLAYKNINTC